MRVLVVALSLLVASSAVAEPLQVYAVNGPLGYFAKRIAGDAAEVTMPSPADEDPAFWQPSPEEITAFQQADLILLNGAGYAKWVANASLPRARLVDTSRAFADQLIVEEDGVSHSHGPAGEHSHAGTAFTTWLDFSQAAAQAEAVADALARKIPAEEDAIAERAATLASELQALDQNARSIGQTLNEQPLIVSHPIYQYLGRAYVLNLHSLTWEPDVAPTDAQLEELDALIAETQAEYFIWENTPIDAAAAAVGERGLTNLVFATGNAMQPADDFLGLMQAGLDALERAASD